MIFSEHVIPQESFTYNVKTILGGFLLKDYIEERAINIAEYIIDCNATVRQTAKAFGVSKSTVHKDDGVIIGTVKGNAKKH